MRQFAVTGRRGKDGAPCTEVKKEGCRREHSQAHERGGDPSKVRGPLQPPLSLRSLQVSTHTPCDGEPGACWTPCVARTLIPDVQPGPGQVPVLATHLHRSRPCASSQNIARLMPLLCFLDDAL